MPSILVTSRAVAAVTAFGLVAPFAPAFADGGWNSGDPGVARISDVSGAVDVHRTDTSGTYAAVLNAPVTVGDYFETQSAGRAEVEFDHATALRVAGGTQLRFTHLTPDDHDVQLAQGTVELRLFRGAGGNPVVETPLVVVRPTDTGRYRITVDNAGTTFVTIRSGRAEIDPQGGGDRQELVAGQGLEVSGSGSSAQYRPIGALAYDAFDGYADARDGGWSRVTDWNYVDGGMVGENDLSGYGRWTNDAQYGQVWQPTNVPADWSPYSDGRWVWQPAYGWTWIGNEPWGYAPYHYGRWFYAGNAWCWTPGAYDPGTQYYGYQPAVVGFFALGAGVGVAFAIGDVGWTPLAPGEAYHPWWRGSGYGGGGYGNGWNGGYGRAYAGNVGRYYRNARFRGGALAVSGRDFASGNFGRVRRVEGRQLARGEAFAGVIPVVPTSRNLAFDGRGPRGRAPAFSHRFAAMKAPAVAGAAFVRQRSAVATLARRHYPKYAPSVARQLRAPARGGLTQRTLLAHAPVVHAAPHRAAVPFAHGRPGLATHAAPHVYAAPHRNAPPHHYVAPHEAPHRYVAPHRTAPLTHTAPHAYIAPHRYVAPVTHAAPHAYTAPHREVAPHYAAPHAYAAPRYRAPVAHAPPHYAAPHVAPVHRAPPPQHAPPPGDHGGGRPPHGRR